MEGGEGRGGGREREEGEKVRREGGVGRREGRGGRREGGREGRKEGRILQREGGGVGGGEREEHVITTKGNRQEVYFQQMSRGEFTLPNVKTHQNTKAHDIISIYKRKLTLFHKKHSTHTHTHTHTHKHPPTDLSLEAGV